MAQHEREVSLNNDKPRDISIAEPVVGSLIAVIFLVLIHVFFEYFGVWRIDGGISDVVPFVDSEYVRYFVTFMTLLLIIILVINIFKFVHQRWTISMFVISTILSILGIMVLYHMHENRALWNPNFMDGLVEAGFYESTTTTMYRVTEVAWNFLSEWLFIILIVLLAIGIIINGYRTIQRVRTKPPKKQKRAQVE